MCKKLKKIIDYRIAKLFVSRFEPFLIVEKTIDQFGIEGIQIINEDYDSVAWKNYE